MFVTSSRLKMPKAALTAAARVLFRGPNCFTSARVAVFKPPRDLEKKVAESVSNFSAFNYSARLTQPKNTTKKGNNERRKER